MRTLRGAWSRRRLLGWLVALTTIVVAGALTAVGFADAAGSSALLVAPLLLLGCAAVPTTAATLASARRNDIGLARLRGRSGFGLISLVAGEPLLALVAGAAFGTVLGVCGAALATRHWLEDDSSPGLSPVGLLLAGGVVVVGLCTVMAGTAWALREPLSVQLTAEERPRRASTAVIFGRVLVFAAAAVSIYRTRTSVEPENDVFVLAAPALVGLAVGQVAVWAVQLASRVSLGWTAERGLDVFLGVRRLARHGQRVSALRLLVAATVVSAVALSGSTAVDDWTESTARLRSGAPLQIPIDVGALGVLNLTRELDPDGDWLMADGGRRRRRHRYRRGSAGLPRHRAL
jgi:hypothetical protein